MTSPGEKLSRALRPDLEQRRAGGLYRDRPLLDAPQGVTVVVEGREMWSFCSNDYLGLANHPDVIHAFRAGASRYGVGAGASHLVAGHQRPHQALEEALAGFLGRERALVYSTGYMANLGVVTALLGRHDTLYTDRLSHASLIDAGSLFRGRRERYAHADTPDLARRLTASPASRRLVATDGVFSMDGDLAPLPALAELCARAGAWLMVDDAHGIGVLGEGGRGTLERYGLSGTQVPILVGTLGKALGTFGAFVAGGSDLIETLIQRSRSYIYTTAIPAAIAQATLASLRLVEGEPWRRAHLHSLITRLRAAMDAAGHPLAGSDAPIQPLILGDVARALGVSRALRRQGIFVPAIRPPTVPHGQARLRITLSAAHTEDQVDCLASSLAEALA